MNLFATGIAVSGNYACVVASGWNEQARRNGAQLKIIDVSDPVSPKNAGEYEGTVPPGSPY